MFGMVTHTDVYVTDIGVLELGPVDARSLPVFLDHLHDVPIGEIGLSLIGPAGCVVLPALDRRLDALIVEIGVVLLLELCEDLLQLLDPVLQVVPLVQQLVERVAELGNTSFSQADQHAELPSLPFSLDNSVPLGTLNL